MEVRHDANGGLTTQEGSIFDELGIKVNINIINDADASSNALVKGSLNAAGYTINRVAFLSSKFEEAGLDVVMPCLQTIQMVETVLSPWWYQFR